VTRSLTMRHSLLQYKDDGIVDKAKKVVGKAKAWAEDPTKQLEKAAEWDAPEFPEAKEDTPEIRSWKT